MTIATNTVREPDSEYNQLSVTSDTNNNITWLVMNHDVKASFTLELLAELDNSISSHASQAEKQFYVLSSSSSKVFNLGGDLFLFRDLIMQNNRQGLYAYMKKCIDTIYHISTLPACDKIALVTGNAFGGGFEAALACDTIIAEKNARFGFPERLFNLFPGMGAYSYLIRRIDASKAQKMIKSAKTYTADELYDMGLVDKVVADGEGHDAVYNHIQNYKRYANSYDNLKNVFQSFSPINYEELLKIGELWVESAFNLSSKDLGLMERLATTQTKLTLHT